MNTTPDPSLGDSTTRLPSLPGTPPLVVPVIEETAVIHREVVESGRVRLSKTVQEHEEAIDLTLLHEEVQVERVPINQYVADDAAAPAVRYEGDTLVVPVVREVVVKRLLLVEELRVTKHQVETQQTQHVTLRHEQVQVDRLSPDGTVVPPSSTP
jgi:uncharacterized protein (TIGR02271 family)